MLDLRAYFYVDRMQPQVAAYIGSTARGFLPVAGVASLFIETRPGMAINRLTDIAVKKSDVKPAMQIVERQYGLLEVHSETMAEVDQAGRAILDELGLDEKDRYKPRTLSTQVITRVLAANEAEKSTEITLVELRPYGASGRVYLGGTEANIEAASSAALQALESMEGRELNR
jgi:hypothetical protein